MSNLCVDLSVSDISESKFVPYFFSYFLMRSRLSLSASFRHCIKAVFSGVGYSTWSVIVFMNTPGCISSSPHMVVTRYFPFVFVSCIQKSK